jgi:NAD-dependent oxidoreductase involved in siderophore biosynthesis
VFCKKKATCSRSKENEDSLWKILKVIIAMYGRPVVNNNLAEHLHADDRVNEKEHNDEKGDVWQRLERLDEGPEQSSYTLAPAEQFHQPHHTKQPKKID